MAKRIIPPKRILLSKDEIDRVNLGLDTALKLQQLPPLEHEQVLTNPGDIVAFTPVVEAVAAGVIFAVKVYNATKFNELEGLNEISAERLKAVNFKAQHSMDKLIQAREQLNKLGQ
jgi:hypothetical protein